MDAEWGGCVKFTAGADRGAEPNLSSMAGFRSLWGSLSESPSAAPGLVWERIARTYPTTNRCADGSFPMTLPQNRKLCRTTGWRDCVVYSFGSRGDFTFEEAVRKQDPRCQMHVFDPTTPPPPRQRGGGVLRRVRRHHAVHADMHIHPVGLAHFDGMGDIPHPRSALTELFPMRTLPRLMAERGHRNVTVIKIDTSGEMEVLHALNASSSFDWTALNQVLMELHLFHPTASGERQRCCYGYDDVKRVFEVMRYRRFRLFSLQPASGTRFDCCAEVAWVRE